MRKVPSELGRWEFLRLPSSSREDTFQVRLLHELAKISVTFDDPHLVSRAGLVPVMALAQRAELYLIAPASANTIAKRAHGLADNLVTAAALAAGAVDT